MSRTWAVIAGGGTGGHSVPALAVARALVARGHAPSTIHMVGSTRGAEGAMFLEAGFPTTLLPGRGLNERRVTTANAAAAGGIAVAGVRALVLMARRRPAVVLSLGGFASIAPGAAAAALRIPLVLHAQNAVPTAGNRVLAPFAKAVAVAYEGVDIRRAVVTGNPVPDAILDADPSPAGRAAARERLGLPADRTVVLAFGGSQGARSINRAVADLAEQWASRADVAIRHVWGRRDWQDAHPSPEAARGLVYQAVEFEDRMPLALAAADLVVARAGAATTSELAVMARPSVLVPLPIAAEDHQMANARLFERVGAAVVLPDADCDGARLADVVASLIGDPERLGAMGAAAATLARRDAADRVAALLEHHARTSRRSRSV